MLLPANSPLDLRASRTAAPRLITTRLLGLFPPGCSEFDGQDPIHNLSGALVSLDLDNNNSQSVPAFIILHKGKKPDGDSRVVHVAPGGKQRWAGFTQTLERARTRCCAVYRWGRMYTEAI